MIEISRTQDEEVGDGTTSVIILGKKYFAVMNYRAYVFFSFGLCHLFKPITTNM